MTDDEYIELTSEMEGLFKKYGVKGFAGILIEQDSGAVVAGRYDPKNLKILNKVNAIEYTLNRIASEVIFTEYNGKVTFRS